MDTSRILSDDEFIEINLKVLNDRKSRDERKANGRLIAVIVAFSCIFIAIYHVWIRNTTVIAGVLVPASIMFLYGGWVVFLAKRDKKKRENYQKSLEEEARKHVMAKLEQGLLKHPSKTDKSSTSSTTTTTSTVHVEFEKKPPKPTDVDDEEETGSVRKKHKHCQKHKHHKNKSRSSTCHHHHHCHRSHHNRKSKARRREELLKEIKEGKLELPKKKPLIRTFSL